MMEAQALSRFGAAAAPTCFLLVGATMGAVYLMSRLRQRIPIFDKGSKAMFL